MSPKEVLARIPYFRVLSPAERAALARRFRSRGFPKGAPVFSEGEPCEGLWVVAEGRIKISRLSARGREQVLHTEGPGATLGEVPLFDGAGYVASATALTPARLFWLPRRDLEALCRRRPDVALAIIATLAGRIRTFASLAGNLALRPVTERLGLLLLAEAGRVRRASPGGVEVTLPGTREEIAARIGTVRELVSRSLAALARRGLIAVRGRRCVLLDVKRLEEAVAP
ncbi:MAG TPA: Crp/Fnr family transcriptional regulator [Methylomirabilota bacterium]|nr:Crp/Fnr family transcriptional regulator [Methylomirabilota bacterium]